MVIKCGLYGFKVGVGCVKCSVSVFVLVVVFEVVVYCVVWVVVCVDGFNGCCVYLVFC